MRNWRLLVGLGLLAILSAAPARQVEAAADLARTMAELDEGNRVEEVDGGVGDDSLEAPKADAPAETVAAVVPDLTGSGLGPGWAWAWAWSLVPVAGLLPGPRQDPLAGPADFRSSTSSSRRQAWLGRFLF